MAEDGNRKRKMAPTTIPEEGTTVTTTTTPAVTTTTTTTTTMECPYLDTINRSVLDFDFEPSCSVSLEAGPHVYGCLVCGKFFRGRGRHTPAYTHSVDEGHFMFVHLLRGTFHCLPDDYEVKDPSLSDIGSALHPTFTIGEIDAMDHNTGLARDLFGRRYLPGFVGLNNLHKTDCVNAVVQALAHVRPLRDYFLRMTHRDLTLPPASRGGHKGKPPHRITPVALAFGELIRKMWSDKRFKSHVDPHMLIQAISVASQKKFRVGQQAEAGLFMAWLLHQLHVGLGGTRKPGSSIIHRVFQGSVQVTTRRRRAMRRKRKRRRRRRRRRPGGSGDVDDDNADAADDDESDYHDEGDDEDDREGSDDEQQQQQQQQQQLNGKDRRRQEGDHGGEMTMKVDDGNDHRQPKSASEDMEETTTEAQFLQLTLDIPEKPLFRDDDGGLVIPQEPLVNVLKKFDGTSFSEILLGQNAPPNSGANAGGSSSSAPAAAGGGGERRRYRLLQLPDYLILHLSRFKTNRYSREKNPTIVAFPVKNFDLSEYVYHPDGREKPPTEEEVRAMDVKALKALLRKYGQGDLLKGALEKSELVEMAVDFVSKSLPDLLSDKYDLVANITHDSPADVGREGKTDPLQEGSYKCHVHHGETKQWYEIQDLHVQETMPQLIGLSESYVLIFERKHKRKTTAMPTTKAATAAAAAMPTAKRSAPS